MEENIKKNCKLCNCRFEVHSYLSGLETEYCFTCYGVLQMTHKTVNILLKSKKKLSKVTEQRLLEEYLKVINDIKIQELIKSL